MGITYKPRPQFTALHNRNQRWAAMNTHRRAGKTVCLVNDLIYGALECRLHRPQLAYIGPTYSQAKRVAWAYLKDYADPYLSKPPQEAELKVTLKNEATIYVLGADNADSLRGMYLDGCVPDEYALFKPSVFSQVIRPALSDRNGWAIFASTPRGKNLFYDICQTAKNNPKEWFYLNLPADTSGIIPARELEDLRKDMDPEEFAQEYLCSFDSALKGAIYANEVNLLFLEKRAVPGPLYDEALPVYCAFDLGFTDATICIWFQIGKDGSIRIIACEATNGTDIFHHIERIQQFPAEVREVFLPHDARAKNLQTGKSIVEQFLHHDIRPTIIPNHKIRDGIAATRAIFPQLYVDLGTTGDLMEAMKAYRRQWNDNLGLYSDAPLHDWASDYCDCLRYVALACGLLGITAKAATKSDIIVAHDGYNLETLYGDNAWRYQPTRRIA